MNTEKAGAVLKTYLEGLEQRLQTCEASTEKWVEKLEKILETLEPEFIQDLKNSEQRIEVSLEKKYIGRIDLQHTLYEQSLKQAQKVIKRQLILGALTLPFLSFALIWGVAALLEVIK